uniref:Mos1 transposase HTH domain-containing protein n=1 Tax=Cacopsylla melanoneura TaxID=428564 RepID=A0A8D8U2F0_9HEMI
MQRTIEQRYAIKLCVGLGKSGSDTVEMIRQMYKDDSLSRTAIFNWHKRFKYGRQHVEDEPRVRRPVTSKTDHNFQRVRNVLNSDRQLSVRMIADQVAIDKMTAHTIITEELGMRKICAKLVPKVLTDDQKQRRVSSVQNQCLPYPNQRYNHFPTPLQSRHGPCRLFLFPKVKSSLKGHDHGTIIAVKKATTRCLKEVPESAYQGAFEAWKSRLWKFINAQGMYFEEY